MALLQGSNPSEIFNFRSPSFSKLGLDREKLSGDDLIGLMLKEPRLIRRPIVKIGPNVYFAASAENMAKIIEF